LYRNTGASFEKAQKEFATNVMTNSIGIGYNISTKKLYLKNKIICLSNFNDIYDELKHLELVLKIHMSN
jgi:hypothetical protein